jgi:L-asparaginase
MTGAMRPPAFPGADGPANILAAVRTAASAVARDVGVMVVLDDVIHAARFVRKTHTSRPSAFASPSVGPLGWIAEENVRIPLRPTRPLHVDLATMGPQVAPVALLPVALGDDGGMLAAIEASRYDGAVIEAFGAGHVPAWLVEELESLAAKMPVVLTSRTGAGEIFARTYGFAGSERDLLGRGLISGGALDGTRGRLLLSLLLTAGASRDDISEAFHRSSS